MLKELKMLLSLRAWLRSTSLQAGGVVGVLGAIQTYLGTTDGMDLLSWVATFTRLPVPVVNGIAMMLTGLLIWILRAKAQWSLSEVAAGTDKQPTVAPADASKNSGQKGYAMLTLIYLVLIWGTLFVMAVATHLPHD
jgi:hypothetical protein